MEFFEAVEARRSIRNYTSQPVDPSHMQKILDAALKAPNSSNMQGWEFYWVRSKDKQKELHKYCLGQPAATTAQELIVCVARLDTWRRNQKLMLENLSKVENLPKRASDYYAKLIPFAYTNGPLNIFGALKWIGITVSGFFSPIPRGPCSKKELEIVMIKSCALACENIMLAASALGLGSCPMEGFDEVRVKKLLGLPRFNSRVVMVVGIGHTDPKGIYGKRLRFDRSLFVHEI